MNLTAFLSELRRLITGKNGFRRHVPVDILTMRVIAGTVLTGASAPSVAAAETNALAVSSAASTTALGTFSWTVPFDYDQQNDELMLKLQAVSGGTTDVPTLNANIYRKRDGAALTAALTTVASAAIPTSAAIAAWRVVDASGNSLRPGDVLTIDLTTGAHTTDTVVLTGLLIQYKSDLVFYDSTLR